MWNVATDLNLACDLQYFAFKDNKFTNKHHTKIKSSTKDIMGVHIHFQETNKTDADFVLRSFSHNHKCKVHLLLATKRKELQR